MAWKPSRKGMIKMPSKFDEPSHTIGTEARYLCGDCGREHTYCWSTWQTQHDAIRPCVYCGAMSHLTYSLDRNDEAFVKILRKGIRQRLRIKETTE
jgi:hypothetical protein